MYDNKFTINIFDVVVAYCDYACWLCRIHYLLSVKTSNKLIDSVNLLFKVHHQRILIFKHGIFLCFSDYFAVRPSFYFLVLTGKEVQEFIGIKP